MKSDLSTAKRKSSWGRDFNAKGHVRQSRVDLGEPFYIRNAKGSLCYAVVGGTIELHGQDFALTGASAKVSPRKDLSIYANTRPSRVVKGNTEAESEAMSKWNEDTQGISRGDTGTEAEESVGRGAKKVVTM